MQVFETRSEYRKYEFKLSYTFTDKENEHGLMKSPGQIEGQPFDMSGLKNCTAVVCDYTDQVQIDEESRVLKLLAIKGSRRSAFRLRL